MSTKYKKLLKKKLLNELIINDVQVDVKQLDSEVCRCRVLEEKTLVGEHIIVYQKTEDPKKLNSNEGGSRIPSQLLPFL